MPTLELKTFVWGEDSWGYPSSIVDIDEFVSMRKKKACQLYKYKKKILLFELILKLVALTIILTKFTHNNNILIIKQKSILQNHERGFGNSVID